MNKSKKKHLAGKVEIERIKTEWFECGRERGREEIIGGLIDLLKLDERYEPYKK